MTISQEISPAARETSYDQSTSMLLQSERKPHRGDTSTGEFITSKVEKGRKGFTFFSLSASRSRDASRASQASPIERHTNGRAQKATYGRKGPEDGEQGSRASQ